MNNTILLYFASLVTLASVSCNSPRRSSAEETKGRPNVIFIFSDDHAFNAIGAYGNKLAKTPNIDRIATEGAVFQNFFVTNSICGPSRAALLASSCSRAH
jgi:arylsulfatase A-like enzyme